MCRRKLRSIATAAGLWALSSCPAYASLIYVTPTVSFSGSASATDTEGGAGSTSDNLGTTELEQFDTATGVLTGATINLVSTRTQSVTVSAVAATGNGKGKTVRSTGTGSSTASLTAPGASYTTSPAISASGFCDGQSKQACSFTTTEPGVATNQNLTVTSSSLDSYVGNNTVSVDRTAPSLSATQGPGVFAGVEETEYVLTWGGDLSVTYSYLLHADPSFDNSGSVTTLNLDFGTVTQNSLVNPLDFSLFNLADIDRTALDLDSFSLTGGSDTGALDTNLAVFSGLAQDSEQAFQATLDTAALGSYLEVYTLTLSDADIGAASSLSSWSLVLTLQGEVIAASAVPLPNAVWLFGSGLLGLVGISRRKSAK